MSTTLYYCFVMLPSVGCTLFHFHRTKSLEAEGRRSGKETPELVHRLAAFLMPTDTFYHQFNPFTTQRSPQLTSLAQLDDVRDVKNQAAGTQALVLPIVRPTESF